jgi:hypothetical protein
MSGVARGVDAALWTLARKRHRPFDGATALISRFKQHAVLPVDTGCAVLDEHFERFLAGSREQEYLVATSSSAVLEPRYGFVFLSPGRVLFESLNRKDSRWPTARASTTSLLKASKNRGDVRTIHLPSVLSLRDFNEYNFWHFVNDIFPKLLLAEEAGIRSDVPAVVGRRFARMKFFPAIEPTIRKYRPIVVQDEKTFIRADKIYCGVSLNNDIGEIDSFLDVLDDVDATRAADLAGDTGAKPRASHAVFVTRSARRPRPVVNIAEIHEVCEDFGLEVIDFDDVSFTEAQAIMRRSDTIVGLHGAGLTNAMFRRGLPTRMGEVIMEDHVAPEYFMLARHWGFAYRGMLGQRVESDDGWRIYRVDPAAFAGFVRSILGAEPTCAETTADRAR